MNLVWCAVLSFIVGNRTIPTPYTQDNSYRGLWLLHSGVDNCTVQQIVEAVCRKKILAAPVVFQSDHTAHTCPIVDLVHLSRTATGAVPRPIGSVVNCRTFCHFPVIINLTVHMLPHMFTFPQHIPCLVVVCNSSFVNAVELLLSPLQWRNGNS